MPNDIKQTIVDLFSFDIDGDYYKDSEKNDLVDKFKVLLFTDDAALRKFLKQWFVSSLNLAKEIGIAANDEEITEPEGENGEVPSDETSPEETGEGDVENSGTADAETAEDMLSQETGEGEESGSEEEGEDEEGEEEGDEGEEEGEEGEDEKPKKRKKSKKGKKGKKSKKESVIINKPTLNELFVKRANDFLV